MEQPINNQRKPGKNIDEMTQEELDRNWEEAKAQIAELTEEEWSKFVDVQTANMIGIIPVHQDHTDDKCPSCRINQCGNCSLPKGSRPVDIIFKVCPDRNGCASRDEQGGCPGQCPRYALNFYEEITERAVMFGLIERLVAEGKDLKTWRPEEDA